MFPRHRHEERVKKTALVLRRAAETDVPWGAQGFAALDSLCLARLHINLLDAVVVCVGHKD